MKQFDNVYAKFGAPMGRSPIHDNPDATVTVFKVRMVDGDYDDGGAYWGGPPSEPLYCARGDGFEDYMRAKNAIFARKRFEVAFPKVKFDRDDEAIFDEFIEGYLVCAEWADAPEGSNARFSNAEKRAARNDCLEFIATCGPLFYEALEHRDAEHLGHDFWLTRTRAGTGFWDRDELEINDIGKDLTTLVEERGFRSYTSLYASRGWLYFE